MSLEAVLRETKRESITRHAVQPEATFTQCLNALAATHFTGVLAVHFRDGLPVMCEVPDPVKIRIA